MIINLQKTGKDAQAALVIHAKCDAVMGSLASQLGLSIPSYRREDRCRPTLAQSTNGSGCSCS